MKPEEPNESTSGFPAQRRHHRAEQEKVEHDGINSTITCPCFVIAGANDDVFGAEASLEMAAELGCGCRVFPGFGHAVYHETPEFKTCLHTFLQSLQ